MTRVLIVDDREENLLLLRTNLEFRGFEVDAAANGAEALQRARLAPPQLVISDLLMPVMDGYTLLQRWKADERLRQVPFVVCTATYTDARDQQLALDLGADAFIVNPTTRAAFMAAIDAVLARQMDGVPAPNAPPEISDTVLLKEYNAALVRKLEEKSCELEQSNRELRDDIARREQAEAALRASEVRNRTLIEQAADAVLIVGTDGRFVQVNASACEMYGYLREEFVGLPLRAVLPEFEWGRMADTLRRLWAGERIFIERHYRRKDGSLFPGELCACRMEGGLALGMVRDITERKRSEAALDESRARMEVLTRRLLDAQESERRAVARELHDEVGGTLTAVKLNLQALRRAHSVEQGEAALLDGLALVDRAIDTMRSLSLDLRPALLDDLGLIPALKWYCERQAQRSGVAIAVALDAIDLKSAPQLESACYRIAQEAVTNALRHAGARHIQVTLHRADDRFAILIADDGGGFDAAAARQGNFAGQSSGLLGMEERALLLGGQFSIDSAPGAGARVRAEFVLPEAGSV